MTESSRSVQIQGLSLRQAALTAGIGLLIMAVCAPVAEFYVFPKIIVDGDIVATIGNIKEKRSLFIYGVMGHFITLTMDVIVAWALYILFAPTNHAFSLLTAWFRLVYTVIAFVGLFNMFTLLRIVDSPDAVALLGGDQVNAQAQFLLNGFRYTWTAGLAIFGVHLFCLGLLIITSKYVPSLFGLLVAVAGLGYLAYNLGGYIAPDLDLGFLFFTFFGELIFMLWLLIGGWWLRDPDA